MPHSFLPRLHNRLVMQAVSSAPALAYKLSPRLRSVNIGLTNACNLRCRMCFANHTHPQFMTESLFRKIMGELCGRDVAVGLTFAGEALLHPQFDSFLRLTRECASHVVLTTNGMLLDKHLDSVGDCVDELAVSLDGLGEVNDNIRIGSRFTTVEDNIQELMKRSVHPRTSVTMTVTSQTPQEVNGFVDYWLGKVDSVRVRPSFNQDGKLQRSCLNIKNGRESGSCSFIYNYLGVLWNGDVVLCCIDLAGKHSFANVQSQGLFEVWNGGFMRDLRCRFASGTLPNNSLCAGCNVYPSYNHLIEYSR